MNIQEYSDLAHQTAIYPNRGQNLVYPILGLLEEFAEFSIKYMKGASPEQLTKEGGDVYWYINATCFETNIPINDVFELADMMNDDATIDQMVLVESIAGTANKYIRGDYIKLPEDKEQKLKEAMASMIFGVNTGMLFFRVTPEEIMQTNIDKLFSRKERGVLKGSGDNR